VNIEELRAKVRTWDLYHVPTSSLAESKYSFILERLEHHATRDWKTYLPAEHPAFKPSYLDRLACWIGSIDREEDQKLLLEYASYISFFSHDDFIALYQTAFNEVIMQWIAQSINISFGAGGAKEIDAIVNHHARYKTWFCPVTDSMDINEFFKVNHLTGMPHRPCFSTLQKLAEESGPQNPILAKNIAAYMENPGKPSESLDRLVLIEDIVGSGSQCLKAVQWAINNVDKPILFIPLILCPNGVDTLNNAVLKSCGKLTFRPIVELKRCDLLGPERRGQPGWPISEMIERLAEKCSRHELFGLDPFGYKSTGCSIVTFTNTPDNTLPIIHHKPSNGLWQPLFPRIFRD
jgi:hypothetical protein